MKCYSCGKNSKNYKNINTLKSHIHNFHKVNFSEKHLSCAFPTIINATIVKPNIINKTKIQKLGLVKNYIFFAICLFFIIFVIYYIWR